MSATPVVTAMSVVTERQVIPVAGHDSMLLKLCGAHAPYSTTRNLVLLGDSAGRTGSGEPPAARRTAIPAARPWPNSSAPLARATTPWPCST